jgi:hypothetical protein
MRRDHVEDVKQLVLRLDLCLVISQLEGSAVVAHILDVDVLCQAAEHCNEGGD